MDTRGSSSTIASTKVGLGLAITVLCDIGLSSVVGDNLMACCLPCRPRGRVPNGHFNRMEGFAV